MSGPRGPWFLHSGPSFPQGAPHSPSEVHSTQGKTNVDQAQGSNSEAQDTSGKVGVQQERTLPLGSPSPIVPAGKALATLRKKFRYPTQAPGPPRGRGTGRSGGGPTQQVGATPGCRTVGTPPACQVPCKSLLLFLSLGVPSGFRGHHSSLCSQPPWAPSSQEPWG